MTPENSLKKIFQRKRLELLGMVDPQIKIKSDPYYYLLLFSLAQTLGPSDSLELKYIASLLELDSREKTLWVEADQLALATNDMQALCQVILSRLGRFR